MKSTNIYVDTVIDNLPVSTASMDTLRGNLRADNVCSAVMKLCQDGWTVNNACSGILKLYWVELAFLTVHDGLP